MRTTLDIDDDVVAAAREFAAAERRSLGAVISELARRGLTPARIEAEDGLPVIRVPSGTPPITPEMVPACARLGLTRKNGPARRQRSGRVSVGLPHPPRAHPAMVCRPIDLSPRVIRCLQEVSHFMG